jgi:hypothetical protein
MKSVSRENGDASLRLGLWYKGTLDEPKTDSGRRTIPLPNLADVALRARQACRVRRRGVGRPVRRCADREPARLSGRPAHEISDRSGAILGAAPT